MIINGKSIDEASLVKIIKKKITNLLINYLLVIIATFIICAVILAVSFFLVYSIVFSSDKPTYPDRILYFAIIGVGVSYYCLRLTLKPLFDLFHRTDHSSRKITKKQYPELFTIIEEVATASQCKIPKEVRVTSECNAFVNYSSLLGYLFAGRQSLTIGLPLIYGMNITELKSILFHELGHFSQKTVVTNRTANLSEFICYSIISSQKELNTKEGSWAARIACWYSKSIVQIMYQQYNNIAPYNSYLSRIQEYDADFGSLVNVGTDGSISALCKVSYNTKRWDSFQRMMLLFQESGRCPTDIFSLFSTFCHCLDQESGVSIEPIHHLSTIDNHFSSRIGMAIDLASHPSLKERITIIINNPTIDTCWNDTPSLSLFDDSIITAVFNDSVKSIKESITPDKHKFINTGDVTCHEIECYIKHKTPSYLDCFRREEFCLLEKDYFNNPYDDLESSPLDNPFTEHNSHLLDEFYIAEKDLDTLNSLNNENSPKRTFSYNGNVYSGKTVPLSEHRSYYDSLGESAHQISRQCNLWLDSRASATQTEYTLWLYRVATITLYDLEPLKPGICTLLSIRDSGMPMEAYPEVLWVVDEFKERTALCMKEESHEVPSTFEIMSKEIGLDDSDLTKVLVSMHSSSPITKDYIDSIIIIYRVLQYFSDYTWDWVKRELICDSLEKAEKEKDKEL